MATPDLAGSRHDAPAWAPPLPPAPEFQHEVVRTPGLRTHLASVGDGPPVLMLHGFPQHWWQFHAVAPRIAAHGYRVLCPDLRGAGWTDADASEVRRLTRFHDVLALLDALGLDRVHLVAHDLGAVTAMQLTYDEPRRFRSAVQLSVPPGFMSFHPKVVPGFKHLPSFVFHRPGASLAGIFSSSYVAHPMSREVVDAHLAPMARPEIDAAVRPVVRSTAVGEGLRMARGVYRRRRLTVPTRFVFGRRDRYWNEEVMRLVCRRPERYADDSDFAYLDDASHFMTDDAPAAVADVVVDWIGRHP